MSVSNDDLRVELARIGEKVSSVAESITDIKTAIAAGILARSKDMERFEDVRSKDVARIERLESQQAETKGAVSVLRWIIGLVGASILGCAAWAFTHITDNTQANRDQDASIRGIDQRVQTIERSKSP